MLINSINFWLFFILFLVGYFAATRINCKAQNVWLLLGSYFFYGWMSVEMAGLLFIITIIFFTLGRWIGSCNRKAKKWAPLAGVLLGVGMLLYFKYTNFFLGEFSALLNLLGLRTNWSCFNIIVPVGISFFTFKLISYIVDVSKGKMKPERDFVTFASWVAFFPTIMSGPIDRAVDTIPQLKQTRHWINASVLEGLKRILWGMFLKMCIADKIAPYTDAVYNNFYHHSGVTVCLAAVLYSFQIYADFSGYSEMAIGVAKILGIKVPENFLRPYFSTNVGDFWRRWHASLMSWFKDYIYIPLGGSRCSKTRTAGNTMTVFAVSGLWHGANWTFIVWGIYHGILVVLRRLIWSKKTKDISTSPGGIVHCLEKYGKILVTFVLCTIGWMVFRSASLEQFLGVVSRIGAPGGLFMSWALTAILPISILIFKELNDEELWNIHFLHSKNIWIQAVSIALLIVYIGYTGDLDGAQFIYFQF